MSEFQEPLQHTTAGTPRWVGLAVAVLGGVSLISLGVGWSALNHANSVEQTTQASVKQANDALNQRLAKEDDINQALQSDLKVVTDKLNLTQGELVAARKQNKTATAAVQARSSLPLANTIRISRPTSSAKTRSTSASNRSAAANPKKKRKKKKKKRRPTTSS